MQLPVPDERHLVLVGLPGAGKTTIGRQVAARLDRPFVDFDEVIEAESGSSIAGLFASEGEAGFRRHEKELTARLVSVSAAVLSPGGGWITRESTAALLRPRSRLVWLQVSPAEAARRLGATASKRPLLSGDPEVQLEELLRVRERYYVTADSSIDTELFSPQLLVEHVARLASLPDGAVG
jgi:shikimate kinase